MDFRCIININKINFLPDTLFRIRIFDLQNLLVYTLNVIAGQILIERLLFTLFYEELIFTFVAQKISNYRLTRRIFKIDY